MSGGKILRNVGMLDMREATEESIKDIRRISNVGMVLISPETRHLLNKIPSVGNLGATLEVPAQAKLLNGQEVFGRDSFKDQEEPAQIVMNGQAIFNLDVSVAAVQAGLADIWVNGQIFYPEGLAGVLEGKIRTMNGQSQSYMDCDKLTVGSLNLDAPYLGSLEAGTRLVVIGSLRVHSVLDNDTLRDRIEKMQVTGSITCREENAEALLGRQDGRGGTSKVTLIPEGHEVISSSIVIDEGTLGSLSGKKVYCTGSVRIEPGVSASSLDDALDTLVIKGNLIGPAAVKEVISRKCNTLEIATIFYEGELWLEENTSTITSSRFEYLDGQATLVVEGKVTIDPSVEPQTLVSRLAKVHNRGKIECAPEQMGAIQSRLGIKQGKLSVIQEKVEKEDENVTENVGWLKL
jgi:hypothetical protein